MSNIRIKYDTKFDAVPQFWQYLAGLHSSDLITELIQNDLDAQANQTVIEFEPDRLICQGDGEPIDSNGWKRLSYLMGAGDLVPRKHHCIGIKNHGLKTCFMIGDQFRVHSDGKHIHQTLYKNGQKNPPYPSAMEEPQEDATAPKKGCKVVVEFRKKTLSVKNGEPLEIAPISKEKIKEIFEQACREAPSRFIGAIRPRYRQKYVLELKHYELGTARFEYYCGRGLSDKGTVRYTRRCFVSGDSDNLPADIQESCLLFTVSRNKMSNIEIPDYYKAPKGFYLEIAWSTSKKGIPKSVKGYRRYPISYNGENANAFSGVGVHFSGPYVSTSERHEASSVAEINKYIDEKCKLALVRLLRTILVERYSAKVFELLMSDTKNPNSESLAELLNIALDLAAIPLLKKPVVKTKKRIPTTKNALFGQEFGPRKVKVSAVKRLVIPVFTWNKSQYSHLLSSLCPSYEDLVDDRLPAPVLEVLATGDCEGWSGNHIRFDEEDVIARFQPMEGSSWFLWQNENEWRTQFGNPNISSKYLDVILEALHHNSKFNFSDLENITPNVYLPNDTPTATLMTSMGLGIHLPPGLSVGDMPPIIHPKIAKHPIFRSYKKWRPNKYTFTEFLEQVDLKNAEENVRRQFWEWISCNWRQLNKLPWTILTELPIWPDDKDNFVTLQSLCRPKSQTISTLLAGIIRVPNRRLLKIGRIAKAKRGPLYLRTLPNCSELSTFINEQLARFSLDKPLNNDEIHLFSQFEKNLADLLSNSAVREVISEAAIQGVALNMTNQLKHVSDLIQLNKDTKHLFLTPEHLLNRKTSIFEKVHGWQSKFYPSSKHILWALQNDSHNTIALLPRLQAYLKAAKAEGKDPLDQDIKDIKCIPDNEKLYAPIELAFRGVRGDYWGTWKHLISGKTLSADVQNIYTSVGVTRRSPTPDVSVEYFHWLESQIPNVLLNNLESIVRQIDNNAGPSSWYKDYQDLPFIPVETSIDEVKLVSFGYATRLHSNIVIPDFDELVRSIRNQNGTRSVLLAICQHPKVRNPLTSFFKIVGIRSLRDYAGSPIKVVGKEAQTASIEVLEFLAKLKSPKISNQLRKRLNDIEFNDPLIMLKNNWRETIQRIQNVSLAKTIEGTYKIRRHLYVVPLTEAFDETTGTIWLSKSENPIKAFFTLISRLIFTERARYLALILHEALDMDFREDELPFQPGPNSNEDESGDEADEPDGEQEPGGTDQTHPGEKPDPAKNIPQPVPIPEGDTARNKGGNDSPPKNPSPVRPHSAIEEKQIENLKQKQYAYHCQICLASHTVKELAPDNSYVELQENRKKLIIAHHLDQVHAGGSRHAGNIIILCSHHHDYYGDTISRGDILKALSNFLLPRTIVFSSVVNGKQITTPVKGRVATIAVPLSGETFQCFFADHHLNYWRDKSSMQKQ